MKKTIILISLLTIVTVFSAHDPTFESIYRLIEDEYGNVHVIIDIEIAKPELGGSQTIAITWPVKQYEFVSYDGGSEIERNLDRLAIYLSPGDGSHQLRFRARKSNTSALFRVDLLRSFEMNDRETPEIFVSRQTVEITGEPELHGSPDLPSDYTMRCAPNPFNEAISIEYGIAEETEVDIAVYDILGRQVSQLVRGMKSPGYYSTTWDAADAVGNKVSSGIYFVKLVHGNDSEIDRIQLIK